MRALRTGMAGPLQVESAVAERPTDTHGLQTVQIIYDLVTELDQCQHSGNDAFVSKQECVLLNVRGLL